MAQKIPQYRNKRFKSRSEVDAWLKELKATTLYFKDQGQDLISMSVHSETGEILNCSAHGNIYCGKFVNMETISQGKPIDIWDVHNDNPDHKDDEIAPHLWDRMGGLVIIAVSKEQ